MGSNPISSSTNNRDYLFGQLDIGWLIGLPLGSERCRDLTSQSGEVALLSHTRVVFHGKLLKKDPKPGAMSRLIRRWNGLNPHVWHYMETTCG